jgi:hypothetical protein
MRSVGCAVILVLSGIFVTGARVEDYPFGLSKHG